MNSFYVFRGFNLFTSKLCVKYCFFADLMELVTSFRACLYRCLAVARRVDNFLHIIPFINFASQFICNPRGACNIVEEKVVEIF